MKALFGVIAFFLMIGMAWSADVNLKWEASAEATGYKIYKSTGFSIVDSQLVFTWDAGIDVNNVTEYTYVGVQETQFVIFKVSAYNAIGETINEWSGAFYNKLWMPPLSAQGLGVGDVS